MTSSIECICHTHLSHELDGSVALHLHTTTHPRIFKTTMPPSNTHSVVENHSHMKNLSADRDSIKKMDMKRARGVVSTFSGDADVHSIHIIDLGFWKGFDREWRIAGIEGQQR